MRKIFLLLIFCPQAFCFAWAQSLTQLTPEAAATQWLIPRPENVSLSYGREVVLDETLTVNIELAGNDETAKTVVATIFQRQFGTIPNIVVSKKENVPTKPEAYRIKAAGKTITISAVDLKGVRHALSTLRQLADTNRDGLLLSSYRIPETEIDDAPAMDFRGFHLCWFPETRYARLEQAVRMAAYYKFNYVVIEFWGTYPSKKHPQLYWQDYVATPEQIAQLVATGKELGVTLIPQFNIYGHASGSRIDSGKHSVLDMNPRYQPIYEPDGWTFCLSNPMTRTVIEDIVLEMFADFGQPPFFHLGLDEAHRPECRECLNSDYSSLFVDHLLYFHKLLADRGCRMMMWHDMLITRDDERFKGYTSYGNEFTKGMAQRLPRDIVICDWEYGQGKGEDETWPTLQYFQELGFTVLASPFTNNIGMRSLGKTVADKQMGGMLCTSWHRLHGGEMLSIFSWGGLCTWSPSSSLSLPNNYFGTPRAKGLFARHLRQIGWDIQNTEYRDKGNVDLQVFPETTPRYYYWD